MGVRKPLPRRPSLRCRSVGARAGSASSSRPPPDPPPPPDTRRWQSWTVRLLAFLSVAEEGERDLETEEVFSWVVSVDGSLRPYAERLQEEDIDGGALSLLDSDMLRSPPFNMKMGQCPHYHLLVGNKLNQRGMVCVEVHC